MHAQESPAQPLGQRHDPADELRLNVEEYAGRLFLSELRKAAPQPLNKSALLLPSGLAR